MTYILHNIRERPNLSSNTLFHFTKSLDIIESILENGFKTKTNIEHLPNNICYSANMLCFCDIPLGQIKYHLKWYGRYGIGMKSKFLKSKGVSPVAYVHNQTRHINFRLNELCNASYTPYLKKVNGYVYAVEENNPNNIPQRKLKKFYDEREWRYINGGISIDKYNNLKELYLSEESDIKLQSAFEIDSVENIEYILVKNAEDIQPLIRIFDRLSQRRGFNRDELISKIITTQQIINDF
jgi:hypothetical protein